ncbi:Co2+/Mg2+ efflux protein ApaG [Kistimonas asteriae]|uniref:Co2+/Mg2+ efflux protein ApaG n=1 Tax=Kistimonas asteriae TaxID=517724 RepID=UPI001BAC9015|nr:Co2+/Mg2+ efflux protein ApaG [Kistimonas asteriae]
MPGSNTQQYQIRVSVTTDYVKDQSEPDNGRYVFAYHITLENTGSVAARLLTRHWYITDGNQQVQEVAGEGVVGQQPHLAPGQKYAYSSGCMLETPVGTMHGSYHMLADDDHEFEASIPVFTLSVPGALH